MNDRHAHNEPLSDEQLVAYLDGEMDPAVARRLEARLSDDDRLRGRLNELDRTWQLLGQLETDAAGRDFTRTTLEMVVAAHKAEQQLAAAPSRRARQAALAVLALVAAGMAGFLAVAAVRPDPNRRLLEDLPVLESLEPYRALDSFQFLASLHQAGLFQEELPPNLEAPGEVVLIDSPEAAQRRIEAMSPPEREQLRRRRDQFVALEFAEQARLRRLYDELKAAAEPESLQAVALRHYDWLKALAPIARAELVELAPDERVEKVKSILTRQASDRIKRLGPDDAQALRAWLFELTDRLTEALPERARAEVRKDSDPQGRRARLFVNLHTFRPSEGIRRAIDQALDESDLARLRAKLNERTRLDLERHPTAEQWRIVKDWIPQLFLRHRWGGLFPDTEEQTLVEFFENELDDTEFDKLLALPAEEMQRELQRLYLQRGKSGPPYRFPRPGPRPGGHRPPENGSPTPRSQGRFPVKPDGGRP